MIRLSTPLLQVISLPYSEPSSYLESCIQLRLDEKIVDLHDDFGDEGFTCSPCVNDPYFPCGDCVKDGTLECSQGSEIVLNPSQLRSLTEALQPDKSMLEWTNYTFIYEPPKEKDARLRGKLEDPTDVIFLDSKDCPSDIGIPYFIGEGI